MYNIVKRFFIIGRLFLILGVLFSSVANAGYGGGEINRFYVRSDGWVFIGLISQLSNTCDFWGEHFKFNATSAGGKNMLSVLVSAKLSKKRIFVWYQNSTAIGTDQSNGCTFQTIAVLNNIGIQ